MATSFPFSLFCVAGMSAAGSPAIAVGQGDSDMMRHSGVFVIGDVAKQLNIPGKRSFVCTAGAIG
ncbi:MAG: hypothetical protein HQ483_03800 [Rhodospirillales bacterium]|nr:hypothetical protein [Rhodospirillales bacterium]